MKRSIVVALLMLAGMAGAAFADDIVNRLQEAGYVVTEDRNVAPSEWDKATFKISSKRVLLVKSKQQVPDWPKTYYRFKLEIDEFLSRSDATARLAGIQQLPPDLTVEEKKAFPLRAGFQAENQVVMISTDVSAFQDELKRLLKKLSQKSV